MRMNDRYEIQPHVRVCGVRFVSHRTASWKSTWLTWVLALGRLPEISLSGPFLGVTGETIPRSVDNSAVATLTH
jgi:hypothetical protein